MNLLVITFWEDEEGDSGKKKTTSINFINFI